MLVGALASGSACAAEDHLEERWYRVEVVLFEQAAGEREEAGPGMGEAEANAARGQELASFRYPGPTALLRPAERDSALRFGFQVALPLAAEQLPPVVLSNLPPPAWHFGPCVLPAWQRPSADPCLPGPPVDLEAEFPDPPFADWPGYPPTPIPPRTLPTVPAPIPAADPDQAEIDADAAAQLARDLAAHEDALRRSSYVWQGTAPSLAPHVRRLARQRPILAFGSWQQALPPRDSPQPLVLQAGEPDAARRYPLEGTLAATIGRYLHFAARMQWQLPDGGIALLTEQRRLRSGELHYLDHPAFGMLVQVEPLALPADLQRRIAALGGNADIREPR